MEGACGREGLSDELSAGVSWVFWESVSREIYGLIEVRRSARRSCVELGSAIVCGGLVDVDGDGGAGVAMELEVCFWR